MEETLKEINEKLDVLTGRREYPSSTNDIDNICEKLDKIIELLSKEAE